MQETPLAEVPEAQSAGGREEKGAADEEGCAETCASRSKHREKSEREEG